MRALLILTALLLQGCAYKVRLSSQPTPAEVRLPDGTIVLTPVDVKLRWAPFNTQRVVVRAPGYRTLRLDLRTDEIRFGRYISQTAFRSGTLSGDSRGHVRFVLVPQHGVVGTWDPSEVP